MKTSNLWITENLGSLNEPNIAPKNKESRFAAVFLTAQPAWLRRPTRLIRRLKRMEPAAVAAFVALRSPV